MTRPADITITDEILSLKLYLASFFGSDEIRHERPDEDVEYTMLIELPPSVLSNPRGKYMSEQVMPLTIQRWCTSYMEALQYAEDFTRLFRKGIDQGRQSRIPVWKWTDLMTPPDALVDPPDRFLRVDDVEAHVLPGDQVGTFVTAVDLRVMGWRIDYTYTEQLIEHVNISRATDVDPPPSHGH